MPSSTANSPRLSTAGMLLLWAAETTAGTRPTTGYTKVPEVKSMPSFNPAPNTIDSTTLEETEYMTYVQGLKDLGGALEYGANLTDSLIDAWDDVLSAYAAAIEAGKKMWWCIYHPKIKKVAYFVGEPAALGLNEAAVGAMLETTLYVTPNSGIVMAEKPTLTEASVEV